MPFLESQLSNVGGRSSVEMKRTIVVMLGLAVVCTLGCSREKRYREMLVAEINLQYDVIAEHERNGAIVKGPMPARPVHLEQMSVQELQVLLRELRIFLKDQKPGNTPENQTAD